MLVTELYKGQGLGNQLACYVATRVIARDRGFEFGIQSPKIFKGAEFMNLDFGRAVMGKGSHDGTRPENLPSGIAHHYAEKKIIHPLDGSDIRLHDEQLAKIPDNTKIDGCMQDEQYIAHRKSEIKEWLTIKPAYDCQHYADENTCVINFRGGEYARHPEFFLRKKYWDDAVVRMKKINKHFRFIVITDDVLTAKKFFPDFGVFHFSIGKDYAIIKNAHYLIVSNSSFAWFPAWLSDNLKFCIAPKYWARHNVSDGYWSLGYNITTGWHYLDRDGNLQDYETCLRELNKYVAKHPDYYSNHDDSIVPEKKGFKEFLKKAIPVPAKNLLKSGINISKNAVTLLRQPFDLAAERRRQKTWLSQIEQVAYRKKIKIYDAFNFFNELETLEIRLNILNDSVDHFVLVESTMTHSGKPKELFYEKNKSMFKKFEGKIIHFVIDTPLKSFQDARARLTDPNVPASDKEIVRAALSSDLIEPGKESFLRDFYEKECVKKFLATLNLNDEDFCYVSDLDEIWNPETPVDYSKDNIYKFRQIPYMYYLNNRSNEDWSGWTGTVGMKWNHLKNDCLNELRADRKSKKLYTTVNRGGWHFSFQGGADRVKTKIESYSHQEINNDETKSKILEKISSKKDVRGWHFKFWKDEKDLPGYLKKNKERYKNLFQ